MFYQKNVSPFTTRKLRMYKETMLATYKMVGRFVVNDAASVWIFKVDKM